MRIVKRDAFNAHTVPILAELKLLKVDQIFWLKSHILCFALKIISSPLSLTVTFPLFDKFTVITPGPPIHITFHFLELILKKNSLFFIKALKFIIIWILKFATRIASVSSNLHFFDIWLWCRLSSTISTFSSPPILITLAIVFVYPQLTFQKYTFCCSLRENTHSFAWIDDQ